MKQFLALLALSIVTLPAYAQSTSDQRAERSTRILTQVHRLDLLNQILPILLTKEQINKILPSLEKAKQSIRETEAKEVELLKTIEAKVDEAVKNGVEKGEVPSRELLKKVLATFQYFQIARQSVIEANVDRTVEAMKSCMNAGQTKSAMNAIDWKKFDPSLNPEKMSDDEKLRLYVKVVLLDPLAYEVLRDIAAKKKD